MRAGSDEGGHLDGDLRADARRALVDVDIDVGFARAVLEGAVDGELWADRSVAPRAFHVVHPCGMSLVWGPALGEAAAEVVRHLRGRAADGAHEWLQVDQRWHDLDWDRLLDAVPLEAYERHGPDGDGVAARPGAVRRVRLNFVFDPVAFAARAVPALAPGVRVRSAAEEDYAFPGSNVPPRFWSDAASFADRGVGRVAEVDGQPAAIAFAAFRTGDDVEVAVETVAGFRRRGLARVVCAAMIADVLAAGRTPVWSCRQDNVASPLLAASLGFSVSRRLPYFEVLPGR